VGALLSILVEMCGPGESSCKPEEQRYILFSSPTLATFRGLACEFLAAVVSDSAEPGEIFHLVKIRWNPHCSCWLSEEWKREVHPGKRGEAGS